jgi:hypothetical protein
VAVGGQSFTGEVDVAGAGADRQNAVSVGDVEFLQYLQYQRRQGGELVKAIPVAGRSVRDSGTGMTLVINVVSL